MSIKHERMEPGDVTRTQIHRLGCFIWRVELGGFAVFGPNSSADSLHHALTLAEKSNENATEPGSTTLEMQT